MTAKELDKLLSRFFKDITKENGEEYEPSSPTSFQRSFQRYFSEKLPFNILDLDDSFKVPSPSNIQLQTHLKRSLLVLTFHLYRTAAFRL